MARFLNAAALYFEFAPPIGFVVGGVGGGIYGAYEADTAPKAFVYTIAGMPLGAFSGAVTAFSLPFMVVGMGIRRAARAASGEG